MTKYFTDLNYSLGDEDTALELSILKEGIGHILCIAGSGGRVLPLLSKKPKQLTCIDISPEQIAMTQLRLTLLRTVNIEVFKAFMGYTTDMSSVERKMAFSALNICPTSKDILKVMFEREKWQAPIYMGNFEKTLIKLSKLNDILTGKAGANIFECTDIKSQQTYYKEQFPHQRWKFLLALFGNSAVLNSILYKGDFPKNNIGISSYRLYQSIFNNLFRNILARDSFFLQLIFFGDIKYKTGLPIECDPVVYKIAQDAVEKCDIKIIKGNILSPPKESNFDFVSISDVPSFLPDKTAESYLQLLKPRLNSGAITIARAHMRIAKPITVGFSEVTHQFEHKINKERTQLWRVNIYSFNN